MELIFEWVEADRGCIMLMDAATNILQPKSAPHAQRRARRPADHHQQDDPRLRDRAERGRRHQRRPPGRPLEPGRQHRANGRPRGDLRAHARALRRGGRDLYRHLHLAAGIAPTRRGQQVHRGPPETDDRHRPPGGLGRRRHPLLLGHGASRAAGRRSDKPSPRSRTTSRTSCKAFAAAATSSKWA